VARATIAGVMHLVLFATLFVLSFSQTQTQTQTTPGAAASGGPIADVNGPGQSVARPAPQCPRTTACQYAERTFLPDGYRLQSLQVCGANCATQYWVSSGTDGQQLIALDPLRGGAVLAVARATPPDSHPPVRVVLPNYNQDDAACCPSAFADTTYTWDAGSNALAAGQPILTSASDFPGWDAVRQELMAEGWILAGV
jgi:hypothetical protein